MTTTITIGTFTCSALTAQPHAYQGESRQGLTARAVRFSGLLTNAQWKSLTDNYNTWRNSRINDIDTLLSKAVGTTISVSFSTHGITWSNVGCWFDAAPEGQQVGAYVDASCTLVNAADALAALLREQTLANERRKADAANVDCTVTAAELQRQKDEADCELNALAAGLADDFAEQDIRRRKLGASAKAAAESAATSDLGAIKAAEAVSELLDKQAEYAGRTGIADDIAAADLDLQVQAATGQATAYTANTSDLQSLETARASVELLQKQAQFAGRAAKAADLVEADVDLETQQAEAKATAYAAKTTELAAIKGSEIDVELLQSAARITALDDGTRLEDLKTARALQAVYDKYISEDLPDLGTVAFGGCTVTLTKPMETRQDGPQVSRTATGASYITGPLSAHSVRQVEGYISSGTYDDLLSWYDTTVSGYPSAGSWFPVTGPTATAEPFLIGGVKSTRYNVAITVLEII